MFLDVGFQFIDLFLMGALFIIFCLPGISALGEVFQYGIETVQWSVADAIGFNILQNGGTNLSGLFRLRIDIFDQPRMLKNCRL